VLASEPLNFLKSCPPSHWHLALAIVISSTHYFVSSRSVLLLLFLLLLFLTVTLLSFADGAQASYSRR